MARNVFFASFLVFYMFYVAAATDASARRFHSQNGFTSQKPHSLGPLDSLEPTDRVPNFLHSIKVSKHSSNDGVANSQRARQVVPSRVISSSLKKSTEFSSYTTAVEAMRPVLTAKKRRICRVPVLSNFGFENEDWEWKTPYYPPNASCGLSWAAVAISWSCNVIGVQGRTFASVFFDSLEVLRTSTVVSTNGGTIWAFDADITRYATFLLQNRTVRVTMNNTVDDYSVPGVFNCSANLAFQRGVAPLQFADLIVPVTGLEGFINSGSKILTNLPANIYRAHLEVTQTHVGSDEVYYTNLAQSYYDKLPPGDQTDFHPGSVFRETLVMVDSLLAGSIWQFPVIYPGGIDPGFWYPAVGIGSFVIPSYVVDITPLVGLLVKAGAHTIGLSVAGVSSGSSWLLSANLHLWLDPGALATHGGLLIYKVAPSITPVTTIAYKSAHLPDASVTTVASRSSLLSGYVVTSMGNLTTTVTSSASLTSVNEPLFNFAGVNGYGAFTNTQTVSTSSRSKTLTAKGVTRYNHWESFTFPLTLFSESQGTPSGNIFGVETFSHGFNFNRSTLLLLPVTNSLLNLTESQSNVQSGGTTFSSSVPATYSTTQTLKYVSNFQDCYSRTYLTENGQYLSDVSFGGCSS
eukprot:TRINITY_DN3841_c0_g1_i1.p1 TRINITY_DN3841_c0_g1~~TRINITY_DN3841_c0_g1_i1.p1  ORF type:complete len:633 (+),score=61.76 TRINITY_DN3841_c0_g1_i1:865-2763(+)